MEQICPVVLYVFFIILLLIGCSANIFTFNALLRTRSPQCSRHFFLASLLITSIFLLILGFADVTTSAYVQLHEAVRIRFCRVYMFLRTALYYTHSWCLAAVSVWMYALNNSYRRPRGWRCPTISLTLIWLVAVACSVDMLISEENTENLVQKRVCLIDYSRSKLFSAGLLYIVGYTFPLCIIGFTCTLSIYHLHEEARSNPKASDDFRLSCVIALLTIIMVLAWCSLHTFYFALFTIPTSIPLAVHRAYFFILMTAYGSAALTPCILYVVHTRHRRAEGVSDVIVGATFVKDGVTESHHVDQHPLLRDFSEQSFVSFNMREQQHHHHRRQQRNRPVSSIYPRTDASGVEHVAAMEPKTKRRRTYAKSSMKRDQSTDLLLRDASVQSFWSAQTPSCSGPAGQAITHCDTDEPHCLHDLPTLTVYNLPPEEPIRDEVHENKLPNTRPTSDCGKKRQSYSDQLVSVEELELLRRYAGSRRQQELSKPGIASEYEQASGM